MWLECLWGFHEYFFHYTVLTLSFNQNPSLCYFICSQTTAQITEYSGLLSWLMVKDSVLYCFS